MYANQTSPAALKSQEQFCEALFELMRQKSIDVITVTELCQTAGLERVTFYRNFENKSDVLDYYLDSQMTLLMRQLPAHSTLENNMTSLFRWTYAEREKLCILQDYRLTVLISAVLGKKIITMLAANLPQEEQDALVQWPVDLTDAYDYGCNVVMGLYFGFLTSWRKNGFADAPDDLAKCMCSFLLR